MNRRAFLHLIGLGIALGPEAIAEAMKPRIYYSIPKAAEHVWTIDPYNHNAAIILTLLFPSEYHA